MLPRHAAATFPVLFFAAAVFAARSGRALAQDFEGNIEAPRQVRPQNNEIAFEADVVFQSGENKYNPSNESHLFVQYTWLPGAGLNKNDEVVPILRRFIRQPLELTTRFERRSDEFDSTLGLHVGGTYWPISRVYVQASVGGEWNEVENDASDSEGVYIAGVLRSEVGVRVLDLLQIGAFYNVRPVLDARGTDSLIQDAYRSGQDQWYGVSIGAATPDDRVLFLGRAGLRNTDWTFDGFRSGDVLVDGPFADVQLWFNLDPEKSLYARAFISNDNWYDSRLQPADDEGNIPLPVEGDGIATDVDLGFLYWFEGKWGFRISLGGGYAEELPVLGSRETGRIRLGIGFTTRY
jgi:hypothetical protein